MGPMLIKRYPAGRRQNVNQRVVAYQIDLEWFEDWSAAYSSIVAGWEKPWSAFGRNIVTVPTENAKHRVNNGKRRISFNWIWRCWMRMIKRQVPSSVITTFAKAGFHDLRSFSSLQEAGAPDPSSRQLSSKQRFDRATATKSGDLNIQIPDYPLLRRLKDVKVLQWCSRRIHGEG